MNTDKKTTFKEWVIETKEDLFLENPAKDFIKDMKYDKTFPSSGDKHYIMRYIRKCGACDKAIEGFRTVWKLYQVRNKNIIECK
jgi:hypothetical protein